jgi:hypothetical protein
VIRVDRAPEPESFDAEVRQPGLLALRELRGDPTAPKRPGPKRKHAPALWTQALPALREAYRRVCAYSAFYIHPQGRDTVDHFVARDVDLDQAYEWDNLRYAALDVNRLKGARPFLDPFEIEDHWFVLNLATFKVEAAVQIPHAHRQTWDNTLRVVNDVQYVEARRWYHERYFGRRLYPFDPDEPIPLSLLEAEAPFVARQLRLQGRLRPEDVGQMDQGD